MAVVSVMEIYKGRSASETVGETRRVTRVFDIKTDDARDDSYVIGLDPRLPKKWSKHPKDAGIIAQDFKYEHPEEGGKLWRLTVEYSSAAAGQGLENPNQDYTPEQNENPLLRPARIRWKSIRSKKKIDSALYKEFYSGARGKYEAITNSAGVPYVPAAEVDDSRKHISISKNVAAAPIWLLDWEDVLNDAAFYIQGVKFDKETVKLFNIELGEINYDKGYVYYVLSMEMEHKYLGWDLVLLDQGFEELVEVAKTGGGTTKTLRRIEGSDGRPLRSPVLLDGKGKKLADGETPKYRRYGYYDLKPFSQLTPYLS